MEEEDTSAEMEQVNERKPKRQKSERRGSPICKKMMDVRSLPRHQRDIHKEIIPTNVCVDETRGVIMVRKSSHRGVAYPVHVQKCVWSPSDVSGKQSRFCENDSWPGLYGSCLEKWNECCRVSTHHGSWSEYNIQGQSGTLR